MQICVWHLVGNISFSQIAFVGEPFSLTTETRFLRGEVVWDVLAQTSL